MKGLNWEGIRHGVQAPMLHHPDAGRDRTGLRQLHGSGLERVGRMLLQARKCVVHMPAGNEVASGVRRGHSSHASVAQACKGAPLGSCPPPPAHVARLVRPHSQQQVAHGGVRCQLPAQPKGRGGGKSA